MKMKEWVTPYLKKLMPDPVLRLSFERIINLHAMKMIPGYEYLYYDSAPCDDLKDKIYRDISFLSGLLNPDSAEYQVTERGSIIFHYDFTDSQTIDIGLRLYKHTPDYLRWLLDRMISQNCHEGIVMIERKLAEIGALDERGRFEL